jgi:hypothetical protein
MKPKIQSPAQGEKKITIDLIKVSLDFRNEDPKTQEELSYFMLGSRRM